ncbi:cytidine deaminase [Morganella morganii]|uniref:Cytidine deaminase n=1 Tax=Morganella morganii TaxID=582 RepID=A0A9Q4CLW1_MORMO|nr:cytidine deaminase [Morganella morganii]MCY0788256.1 cytidine deaminase [Morganella morganii]
MQNRFHAALNTLPSPLQTLLTDIVCADTFPGYLSAKQVTALCHAAETDEDALALAILPLAAACAVTPVSRFNVGAVAHGLSGNLYFGANMEFCHVPLQQTVHAEQSAITHAWLRGENGLRKVTVNYTPCGHCRQFMNELNSGTELLIQLPELAAMPLKTLLPHAFGPVNLGIETRLFDQVHHGYHFLATNAVVGKALEAANRSHAPYSHSHSGVALQDSRGRIYSGAYIENAAFNPGLPPLQAALIFMNMAGGDLHDIHRAVLVEGSNATLSQWESTSATLNALGCQDIALFSY